MNSHVLIPYALPNNIRLIPQYRKWLSDWLFNLEENIEDGIIASSQCVQAFYVECLLHGEPKLDWIGILESYLTDSAGDPLAYSENYGRQLYQFSQWKQSPIHAIHTHWWIHINLGLGERVHKFEDLIAEHIQPSGWIYNPAVSVTSTKTRMKSELLMSLSMGIEIMMNAGGITPLHKRLFEATLSSMPFTGYLSAEYFRLFALEKLNALHLSPTNIHTALEDCIAGQAFCDFSVESKVDDYMGTAKRTSRDHAEHSAISSLHARAISKTIGDCPNNEVEKRLKDFAVFLIDNPFAIPAFQMRDIPIPFGADISPLEIIAAAYLTTEYQ